jgi:hypothetical protein
MRPVIGGWEMKQTSCAGHAARAPTHKLKIKTGKDQIISHSKQNSGIIVTIDYIFRITEKHIINVISQ